MCVDCSNTINTLPTGSAGLDGDSSYVYIATATDDEGADFALYEDEPTQCWKAILTTTTPIATEDLDASDFAGLWFNTCGTNGTNGSNGTNGTEGVDGPNWIVDTVAPSTLYNNGDYYLNTVSGWVYEQVDEAWEYIGSLKGPAGNNGTNGTNGTTWTNANGVPDNEYEGTIGDLYLNNATGNVYEWGGSTWSIVSTIMGPQGPTGNTGATGAAGAPQNITSNDSSITVISGTNTFDLSIPNTSWTLIPYDNLTSNVRKYSPLPENMIISNSSSSGLRMNTSYYIGSSFDTSTANSDTIYEPYDGQNDASKAENSRLQYKVTPYSVFVKGNIRRKVTTDTGATTMTFIKQYTTGEVNTNLSVYPSLSPLTDVDTTAVSTNTYLAVSTNHTIGVNDTTTYYDNNVAAIFGQAQTVTLFYYPLLQWELDLTEGGSFPCTVYLEKENTLNFNTSNKVKIKEFPATCLLTSGPRLGTSTPNVYAWYITVYSNTAQLTGLDADSDYIMTININGSYSI